MNRLHEPPHIRRNYWLNATEGAAYVAGATLVSADTVLPQMMHTLGAPDWAVGIVPFLIPLGWGLPPLFLAHRIDRLRRLKPLLNTTGVFQRLPFLFSGLLLLHMGPGAHSGWAILAALSLASGLSSGMSSAAWLEMLARALPVRCRASAWAFRNLLCALLGLPCGFAVKQILSTHPNASGYGYLYLLAFACVAISYVLFVGIKEAPPAPGWEPPKHGTFPESIRAAFRLIQHNSNLRTYFISRLVFLGSGIMTPFFAIQALKITHQGSGFLGALLIAMVCGATAGNLIAGWLGDRFGAKLGLQLSQAALLMVAVGLFVFPNCQVPSLWLAMSALRGFGQNLAGTSSVVLTAEICDHTRRSSWFALNQTFTAPLLLITGLVSGWIQTKSGSIAPAALASAMSLIGAIWLLRQVTEPRHAGVEEAAAGSPE